MRPCLKAFERLTEQDAPQQWVEQFQICLADYMSAERFSLQECDCFYTATHRMMRLPLEYDAYANILALAQLTGPALSHFYLEAARSYYARSQRCSRDAYFDTLERLWAYHNLAYGMGAAPKPVERERWEQTWQIAYWLEHWPNVWQAGWHPEPKKTEGWLVYSQQRLYRAFQALKTPFQLAQALPHYSVAVQEAYSAYMVRSFTQLLTWLQATLNAAIGEPQQYRSVLDAALGYAKELTRLGQRERAERWVSAMIEVQTHPKNAAQLQGLSLPALGTALERLKTEPVSPGLPSPALQWMQTLRDARQRLRSVPKECAAETFIAAQQAYTNTLKTLFSQIADWTTQRLGPPPAPFTLLGFGSVSRGDMIIYSDIECVVLIDNNSACGHPYYPAWIAQLKAVLFTQGEPCIIEADKITSIGLRLDADLPFSAGAWTLQSPAQLAEWVYATLTQPEEERRAQGHENRIHASGLLHAVPLYTAGSADLFQRYQTALQEKLTPQVRDTIAIALWEFNRQQCAAFAKPSAAREINLKNAYLKPLTLMTQVWAFVTPCKGAHPIEILQRLAQKHLAPDWVSEAIAGWIRVQRWRIDIQHKTPDRADTLVRADLSLPEMTELTALNAFLERIIMPLYRAQALPDFMQSQTPFHPVFAEANALLPPPETAAPRPPDWDRIQRAMGHFLLLQKADWFLHHTHYQHWPPHWRWPDPERHYFYDIQTLLEAPNAAYRYTQSEQAHLLLRIQQFPNKNGDCLARLLKRRAFYEDLKALWLSEPNGIQIDTVDLDHPERPLAQTYYLSKTVEQQLFKPEKDGSRPSRLQDKPKSQGGRHTVLPVTVNGKKFWAKVRPEQPGTEQGILELDYLLTGGGSIPEEVMSILWLSNKPIAIWWSEDVGDHAEVLATFRKDPFELRFTNPPHVAALNLDSFHSHLLRVLLTNPEDDKGDDYFLVPNGFTDPPTWNLKRIDNERAYFTAEDTQPGYLGVNKSLQVKSLLYCLDKMQEPLQTNSPIFQRLLDLNIQQMLEHWLRLLQDWHGWYQAVTTHETRAVHLQDPRAISLLTVITPPEIISELFTRALLLQDAIQLSQQSDSAYTGLKWLAMVQKDLSRYYEKAFKEIPPRPHAPNTACARFSKLTQGAYELAQGCSVSKMTSIQAMSKGLRLPPMTPPLLEAIARGLENSPAQAFEMLSIRQAEQLETILRQLQNPATYEAGQRAFKALSSARRQIELIKRLLEQKPFPPALDMMMEVPFQSLNFGAWSIFLTPKHLAQMAQCSPHTLQQLTLSNAPKITDNALEKLLTQCELLAALTLERVPVTYLGKSGLLGFSPLIMPHLRSLTVRHLEQLTTFQLQTPPLSLELVSIPPESVNAILSNPYSALRTLSLASLPLKQLGNQNTPLVLPQLTTLTLQDLPQLTDIGVQAPKLERLSLQTCDALENLETRSERAQSLLDEAIALSAQDPPKATEHLDNALSLEPNHILKLIEIEHTLTRTLPDYIPQYLRVNPESPRVLTPQFRIAQRLPGKLQAFLTYVAEGEQGKAEAFLQKCPALGLRSGEVTDLSKRTFRNITALQYALWALDWHMWTMLLKYIPPEAAGTQIAQLETGPWVSQHGVMVSWQNLIDALDQYISEVRGGKSGDVYSRTWNQQVGGAQLLLPAHVINEYCHPTRSFDPPPDFTQSEPSDAWRCRTLDEGEWFTTQYNHGTLGVGFAVCRGSRSRAYACTYGRQYEWFFGAVRDSAVVAALEKTRQAQRAACVAQYLTDLKEEPQHAGNRR